MVAKTLLLKFYFLLRQFFIDFLVLTKSFVLNSADEGSRKLWIVTDIAAVVVV